MQLFSGPSPVGLATIFYCLRFETSLFVASYDSQLYGGGILTRLHTGLWKLKISDSPLWRRVKPLCTDQVENTVSKNTSIVACVSVAAGTCLPSSCLEAALVYLLISRSLHRDGSARYIIISQLSLEMETC
jgi:hypothetical protein